VLDRNVLAKTQKKHHTLPVAALMLAWLISPGRHIYPADLSRVGPALSISGNLLAGVGMGA
jgi:hypothetical protein